jgi:hypothetical protein
LAAAQNSKQPDAKVAKTTKRAIHEFTRSNSKQGPLSCEFVDRSFCLHHRLAALPSAAKALLL